LVQPPPAPPPVADLEAPATPPPRATFRSASAISFRHAGGYKLERVAGNAIVLALSPDASRMVFASGKRLSLNRVGEDAGIAMEGSDSSQVVFSSDGSLLAIGDAAVRVHDTQTGAQKLTVPVPVCAMRFEKSGALLVHPKGPASRLRRIHLGTGVVEELGASREVSACAASHDGARWIVSTAAGLALVDGASGRSRLLADSNKNALPSPAADRWCSVPQHRARELWCERVSDGGRELLLASASYPELRFDPHGKRALVGTAKNDDPAALEWSMVDFGKRELRPLVGFWQSSGSLPRLLPEGEILAMGGPKGMTVFDLARGEKRYALVPGRPLYAAYPLMGHPRRFAAGSESPSGSLAEDAYLAELP
jgi:hypothetical protein